MTPEQMEALFVLMGKGDTMSQRMKDALRDFFCPDGARPTQKEIAERHGVSKGGLHERIARARKVINYSYQLVTGEQPQ